jgi:hypothetical protein
MTSTEISLAALCVTVLGALIATVFKASALSTRVEMSINRLESKLGQIDMVPLVEQRLRQLEEHVHDEMKPKLANLWQKVFSHDKHIAVITRGSKPDM